MMESINRQALETLMASQGGPHVSIYLPAPERPNEASQDGTRLSNLLRDTRQTLVEYWMPQSEAKSFLQPLEELCHDTRFLADRNKGVAIFRSVDTFQSYQVETLIEENCVIARRFHVRPIIAQAIQTSFHVLTLSKNRVALLSADGDSLSEMEVPNLPSSFSLETADVTADRGAQSHSSGIATAGKQAAVFHGQGGHPDTVKTELRAYLHRVDDAVQSYMQDISNPIVLAGVDELTSMYRDISNCSQLCETSVSGNFDHVADDVLLEKAAVVIAEERERQREAVAKCISEPRHHHVATDPEQVLCAAYEGRVDTLFFDESAELYGSFYPDTKTMQETRQRPSGDPADPSRDLIEMAVAQTLLHRGSVYPVIKGKMPVDANVAASLRY